jgi:hypothetical protein
VNGHADPRPVIAQQPLPDNLGPCLAGDRVPATNTRRRPPAWIHHDLNPAQGFPAAYRERPGPADLLAAQRWANNERGNMRLVAELNAASIDTPAPDRSPSPTPDRHSTETPPTERPSPPPHRHRHLVAWSPAAVRRRGR